MDTACIDPQARICLLRHLHALRHGLREKPCYGCEPAAEAVALSRGVSAALIVPEAVADPEPAIPAAIPLEAPKADPSGIDLNSLRRTLRPILAKQAKSGQQSVYLSRLQGLYNAEAPKGFRLTGNKRFCVAVSGIKGLATQGSWLLLDAGAREFCSEGGW